MSVLALFGAGDGTRTRDNLLGGQELYQLSYSRKIKAILPHFLITVKGVVCGVQDILYSF